jgi:hypothetical protein
MSSTPHTAFRVLIVERGVAGLEAAPALRELAGERIATTLLSGTREFVHRSMRVAEPFGGTVARHYSLEEIARVASSTRRHSMMLCSTNSCTA